MQMKRIADDVVGEVVKVADLLGMAPEATPEPWAAMFASGSLVRDGDNVRAMSAEGAVLASAGLGDHVGLFGDEVLLLGERALLRGFDPVA